MQIFKPHEELWCGASRVMVSGTGVVFNENPPVTLMQEGPWVPPWALLS